MTSYSAFVSTLFFMASIYNYFYSNTTIIIIIVIVGRGRHFGMTYLRPLILESILDHPVFHPVHRCRFNDLLSGRPVHWNGQNGCTWGWHDCRSLAGGSIRRTRFQWRTSGHASACRLDWRAILSPALLV